MSDKTPIVSGHGNPWTEVARYINGYDPVWDSYNIDDGPMHASCSRDGLDQLIQCARITDQHREALSAWMDVYGLTQCEHGRPLTDLSWEVNDYAFELGHADRAVFILCGWHERDGDPLGAFCVPWGYHAAGVFFPW